MDLSGIIFVALAIAWAVYLVPKALRHHDEVARNRSVDRFSATMRVLARREPVSGGDARLVLTPGRGPTPSEVTVKGPRPTADQLRARREATRRATGRRRNVLGTLMLANAVVAGLAAAGTIDWIWQSVPAGLVVVWLVLCRVMVRGEHAALDRLVAPDLLVSAVQDDHKGHTGHTDRAPEGYDVERNEQGFDEVAPAAETSTMPAVGALWDPLPVTLPTYVTKAPAARRTVRTIELGEPGAWTSGHTAESASIAREAEATARADRDEGEQQQAVGS
ncbi:divisome protein SepX/GlpR [Nocardioides donggukensis]|uniref:Uncharacterized protein n=1 Tax=Nocardioides donggukensis TaxID=2774019 RepID=A0A927Q2T3_9ACTN|nr:hypothetical protein [Nocardioides donggukensis]MBD8870689.1 hypothetical protein [Nocardioides donggukensis]